MIFKLHSQMYFENTVELIFLPALKLSMTLCVMFVPEYSEFILLGS